MMDTKKSFVKAAIEYFSTDPHGRKVDIPEFKGLTVQDKVELSQMLLNEGVDHEPYAPPTP